jgi:hypothetical protein
MSDAGKSKARGNRRGSIPRPRLPDPSICRAKHAGFGDYVGCLVQGPHWCPHGLNFAGGLLCLHPDRDQIIAWTKAAQPPKGTLPAP